ncbi:sulfotransferase family protein [bacterium]|nr:sulfotransferase family protein [bacterium]
MALRIIGAGVGRTGTNSLKLALERLTGGRCYHMVEVFAHPEHVPPWRASFEGRDPDWAKLFEGFTATVDWPAAGRWRSLATAWPDAPILLSTRRDAEQWWRSAEATIFEVFRREHLGPGQRGLVNSQEKAVSPAASDAAREWSRMGAAMMRDFSPGGLDREAAIAAYERHNAAVRAEVPRARLVEWRPGDGWEPLCRALDVAVPDEPFPHVNTTSEFRTRAGWD